MKTSKQILDELFRMLYPILEEHAHEKQLKEILDKNRITVKDK